MNKHSHSKQGLIDVDPRTPYSFISVSEINGPARMGKCPTHISKGLQDQAPGLLNDWG